MSVRNPIETKEAVAMTSPSLMRLNCERYHVLVSSGVLTEEDRVELIDGYLFTKMSIGSKHGGTVNYLNRTLGKLLGDQVIVAIQNPVTIKDYSEPEPDVVVAKFREDFYTKSHPYPEDVNLVIEVSDSSLDYDKNIKVPLYASCGIPEVWVVDLNQRQVLVYRQPEGDLYREQLVFGPGEDVPLPTAPGIFISVNDLGI